MTRPPDPTKPHVLLALLVCVLVFLIYNSNFRVIHTADSIPAREIPFTLLLSHTIYLDGWIEPYLTPSKDLSVNYYLTRFHGHWLSNYPVVLPLAITPLYILPAWWYARQHPPFATNDVVTVALVHVMEKLCASLIAALSVGLLYLALRAVISPAAALALALIYGLTSDTWAISSQALWRHGFTELCFAFFLWVLVTRPETRAGSFWAGLALALASANKAGDALMAIAFLVYFARQARERLALFLAPVLFLGSLVISYNFYFFGHLMGAVANPLSSAGVGARYDLSHNTFLNGFLGLLVSPNRGLLIYSPWAVFSLWGLVRLWKDRALPWGRYLLIALAAIFVGHARFWGWWGGWCYGPRYLTDLLPFLAFALVPLWPRIQSSPWLRSAFVLSVVAALWIQVVGVYYYPRGNWDGWPANVDGNTRRLWDWTDTQISRSWKAGPAEPELYDELYLLIKQVTSPRASLVPCLRDSAGSLDRASRSLQSERDRQVEEGKCR